MSRLRVSIPAFLLAAALIWSSVTIALRDTEDLLPGTTVLRIGHWQLEAGVRDAFDKLGREFANIPEIQRRYGRVVIRQDAIPEEGYGQWLTSQMLGGTAPDLVEVGKLPDAALLAFENRYLTPLNDMAVAPNPFNKGTELEGVPLRNTYQDGMAAGYEEQLQSYVRVPLSRATERVFYNRTLLKGLTGLDAPPRELRAFLSVCRQIGQKRQADGQPYVAIASSGYHAAYWFYNTAEPLTYSNLYVADLNRDGTVTRDEAYAAIASGRMHFGDGPWRARFAVTRDLAEQFQPGFIGVGRDEALFLFAQQRAVFLSTGTWDIGSLMEQARGKFDVGIAAFPQASPRDPELGRFVAGPHYDPAEGSLALGISNTSKHPDLARQFLQFLASRDGNAQLNKIVGWIPVIENATIPPALARFAPVDEGMYPAGYVTAGPETLVAFTQFLTLYETDPAYTYDQFVRDFTPVYLERGRYDWAELRRQAAHAQVVDELRLAGLRGFALMANAPPHAPEWIAYRRILADRSLMAPIEQREREQWLTPVPDAIPPYSYRPEALEAARRALLMHSQEPPAAGAAK